MSEREAARLEALAAGVDKMSPEEMRAALSRIFFGGSEPYARGLRNLLEAAATFQRSGIDPSFLLRQEATIEEDVRAWIQASGRGALRPEDLPFLRPSINRRGSPLILESPSFRTAISELWEEAFGRSDEARKAGDILACLLAPRTKVKQDVAKESRIERATMELQRIRDVFVPLLKAADKATSGLVSIGEIEARLRQEAPLIIGRSNHVPEVLCLFRKLRIDEWEQNEEATHTRGPLPFRAMAAALLLREQGAILPKSTRTLKLKAKRFLESLKKRAKETRGIEI